ncbi:MAG: DUF2812 domain-containing protein [Tissierellia bacterium]|nr:DUF2812 domain-containing protein [Tissierellia bacterium]
MKKIKFFLDPFNNLEPWLNDMAKRGYRLESINNFIYDFEKTNESFRYSTQFIGANTYADNKQYTQLLQECSARVFHAPINQGSIVLGKIKFRPYARGSGKLANSLSGYNKEILVVENAGDKIQHLLTNAADISIEYRDIRNAYLQATVMMTLLLGYKIYKMYMSNFEIRNTLLSVLVFIVWIILLVLLNKAQSNYQMYKSESDLME